MNSENKKFWIITISFFVFYLFFGLFCYTTFGLPNNTSDFLFHWQKLQGTEQQAYKPLYYLLMLPFSSNIFIFWLINISIIIFGFSFLIFKISNWWGVLIYFTGISLAHQQIYAATFPSAIVIFLFLFYWLKKTNWLLLCFLTVTTFFIHSYALPLFAGLWIIEITNWVWKQSLEKKYWGGVFLMIQQLNNVKTLIGCFLSQIPVPIAIIGFLNLKWKETFFVILSFLSATIDFRAIAIAQIFLGISFAKKISGYSKKFKLFLIIFLIIQLAFYLLDFVLGTWNHLR